MIEFFFYPRFKKFLLSGMLETCKRLKLLNLVYTIKCFDIFCLAFICSCIQYPVCMSKWVAVNDRGFPEGSTAFALSSWTLCKNYYSQSTWEYAFHFQCKIFAKKAFYLKPTLPKYCQCDEKCNILYWIPIILLSWAYFWHNGKFVSCIYSLQRKATPSNLQTFYTLLSNTVPFKAP